MSKYFIRVNGVGNAWPVPLGTTHPFYDHNDPGQLANASYSLIKSGVDEYAPDNIEWEILIDAGHGIIQYLIRHGNRFPDAIALTHSHLDHTLSLDWIIQSYFRHHKKERKLPLYSSPGGLKFLSDSFPQLPPLTDYRILAPGESNTFEFAPELTLTAFPVYHGEKATGPSMLLFEIRAGSEEAIRILFSGDLLCPLLRKADYRHLEGVDMAFLDANNRFPYTSSNHWSVCSEDPEGEGDSRFLKAYRSTLSCTHLIAPHLPVTRDPATHPYLDEFLAYCDESIPFSVFDFCHRINPGRALLVHYSGMEDRNHHGQEILNPVQLENWANAEAERRGIRSEFRVPGPGDINEIG